MAKGVPGVHVHVDRYFGFVDFFLICINLNKFAGDKLIDEGEFAEVMKLYGVGNNAAVKSFHKATGGKVQ